MFKDLNQKYDKENGRAENITLLSMRLRDSTDKIQKWIENIIINTEGRFQDIADRFADVWVDQLKRRAKVKKKYGGITEDLEFDRIDFAPENIGEYLRLKNATHLFLKKMTKIKLEFYHQQLVRF